MNNSCTCWRLLPAQLSFHDVPAPLASWLVATGLFHSALEIYENYTHTYISYGKIDYK